MIDDEFSFDFFIPVGINNKLHFLRLHARCKLNFLGLTHELLENGTGAVINTGTTYIAKNMKHQKQDVNILAKSCSNIVCR